jgi:hypothetical protein
MRKCKRNSLKKNKKRFKRNFHKKKLTKDNPIKSLLISKMNKIKNFLKKNLKSYRSKSNKRKKSKENYLKSNYLKKNSRDFKNKRTFKRSNP